MWISGFRSLHQLPAVWGAGSVTEICLYKAVRISLFRPHSFLFSLADLTPGHPGPGGARLQGLRQRPAEHVPVLNGGKPEGELISEVVASPPGSVALNKRCRPEVFETGAGAGESLSPALSSSCRVLQCKQISWKSSHQTFHYWYKYRTQRHWSNRSLRAFYL